VQSFSLEMPKSNFSVELDAANATWLSNDVALFSTKTGELLLLTLVNDGRHGSFLFYFIYLSHVGSPNCLSVKDNDKLFLICT
jgi:hypothetical protein